MLLVGWFLGGPFGCVIHSFIVSFTLSLFGDDEDDDDGGGVY